WSQGQSVLDGQVLGTRPEPYRVNILFSGEEVSRPSVGVCSCRMHINCKHVAATLIGARQPTVVDSGPASWERLLEPLARNHTAHLTRLALQLDFRPDTPEVLRARPLSMGRSGRWVKGDAGWHQFTPAAVPQGWDPAQHELLAAIRGLGRDQWSTGQGWKRLDDVSSTALFALLRDAERAGLTLI